MKVASVRAVVCLCLWLLVCQVRGSYIPQKMNKTIQNLLLHYKISPEQRFNGKPVFPKKLLVGKTEARMVFIGGVLETYENLIKHMVGELSTPSPQTTMDQQHLTMAVTPGVGTNAEAGVGHNVRRELEYILDKIQELKKNHYKEQETLLQELHSLNRIQMDDVVIQNKALRDLLWLYEEASSLANRQKIQRRRRRRRRQAQRVKTHLGA